MKEIQVEILPDGMAIECNPLGEMPVKSFEACYYASAEHEYLSLLNDWQLAESQRRVFKIVGCKKDCSGIGVKGTCGGIPNCKAVGTKHPAEIVNEKEVIIK